MPGMTQARYDIRSPAFAELVDETAPPQVIADGFTWIEGPVWWHNALHFNDIPNRKMYRWSEADGLRIVLEDNQFANGNTLDLEGRMISCEHGGRRVIRRPDPENPATQTPLATHTRGRRLNSPNDVVVRSDGSVFFTDPPYGIISNYEGFAAESELDGNHVYRIDPSGTLHSFATDFDRPNGLAFSPDERVLYVADSGAARGPGDEFDPDRPHHIRALNVAGDSVVGNAVFATITPGVPDGLRVDTEGHVWTSTGNGIWCLAPDGTLLGRILLPDPAANLCFGGENGTTLFITATSRLWRLEVATRDAITLARKG